MLGVDGVHLGMLGILYEKEIYVFTGVDGVHLGMLGIGWWGVDEMIRWLIKIIYNMSWYFICFLLSLND